MTYPCLRNTLRQSTSDAHSRVDALVGGGFADRAAYRHYLRGMHGFLAASRAALGHQGALEPLQVALLDDMRMLDVRPLPDVVHHGPRLNDEAARLGWTYVLAGASVGARPLMRQAQLLGYGGGSGADFLQRFARSPMWGDVLSRLDAATLDPEQAGRCRDAAVAAFAAAEAAFHRARNEDFND